MPSVRSYKAYQSRARDLAAQATFTEQSPEAKLAAKNFPAFYQYLTRNLPEPLKVEKHMELWVDQFITGQHSKSLIEIAGPAIDLLAPRGGAKSSFLAFFCAWAIGIHAAESLPLMILYISYTVDVARPKSKAIKNIIASDEYREIFPMVLPGNKWSDEYWTIDYAYAGIPTLGREMFTVCCAGLKGAIVSKRSHLCIFDDIIKSESDIKNSEIREEMCRNWRSAIRPTIFEGGRAISLGTRYRGDDIHVTEFIPEKGWIQIEQEALVIDPETGEEVSYWPEMWSTEYLLNLRDGPGGDPIAFAFQYMNKVVRISELSIDPDWIERGEVHLPENIEFYDQLAVGVDLSSKTDERNDYTVFTLGGRIGNYFHILDVRRGRWMGNIDKLEIFLELLTDWDIIQLMNPEAAPNDRVYSYRLSQPLYLFGEDVQYQASLQGDFRTYITNQKRLYEIQYRPSKTLIQVEARKVTQDKLQRLRSISGLFQNGLVRFNQYAPLGQVIYELENFGSYAFDDCVDSVYHLLRGLRTLVPLDAVG